MSNIVDRWNEKVETHSLAFEKITEKHNGFFEGIVELTENEVEFSDGGTFSVAKDVEGRVVIVKDEAGEDGIVGSYHFLMTGEVKFALGDEEETVLPEDTDLVEHLLENFTNK